jgi:hypothetical protein
MSAIARLYLSELTPGQRRAICNGVGPRFAQVLFKPVWRSWLNFEPNKMFSMIACQHDLDYWVGGGICEKLAADDYFISGCMQIAIRHKGARKWVLTILAQAYGVAVKLGLGWVAWHWGRSRTRADLVTVKELT